MFHFSLEKKKQLGMKNGGPRYQEVFVFFNAK